MIAEEIRKGDFKLTISYDENAPNPRTDYDPLGKMICWHRRYNLGDKHNFEHPSDLLISLIEAHVGDTDKAEQIFERICKTAGQEAVRLGSERLPVIEQHVFRCVQDTHVALPLYLYDHSVLSMSTGSFIGRAQHAEWDSGRVGVIYADKPTVEREYGAWNAATRRKAKDILKSEVSMYDCYLRDECYWFELRKGDELIDSCGGFLGELDDAKQAIAEYLPDEMKDALKRPTRTGRAARSAGMAI